MLWEIYTDGSTKANGTENSVGGWAYAIYCDGKEFTIKSKGYIKTTNQRMELAAAINALDDLCGYFNHDDLVIVYSDSAYLINCKKQEWYKTWRKNGWINSKNQPVANRDLWTKLLPWFDCGWIMWVKVKGHDTNKYNNLVDNLAQKAADRIREEQNESNCDNSNL